MDAFEESERKHAREIEMANTRIAETQAHAALAKAQQLATVVQQAAAPQREGQFARSKDVCDLTRSDAVPVLPEDVVEKMRHIYKAWFHEFPRPEVKCYGGAAGGATVDAHRSDATVRRQGPLGSIRRTHHVHPCRERARDVTRRRLH